MAAAERTNIVFDSDVHVRHMIDKIIVPLGRRLDEDSPLVDARLPDGSRVNAAIPPVAIDGCNLTIRKFATARLTIEDLIRFGALTPIDRRSSSRLASSSRMNIVVAGGTGSGKTTLLNVLSSFIPEHERIVTIEDAAELQLGQDQVVRLESKPAECRRHGRRDDPRARAQRAAHAPRTHRRRRVPRRRGAGHAPGDEHRPRRLAHHAARQQPRATPSAASKRWRSWAASTSRSASCASRSPARSS